MRVRDTAHAARIHALLQEPLESLEDLTGVSLGGRRDDLEHDLVFRFPQQVAQPLQRHLPAPHGSSLVQKALGVSQPAVGLPRKLFQGRSFHLELLLLREVLEGLHDDLGGDAMEVVLLAAGSDGGRHLVRLGRREDEVDGGRRLLERLEESVETPPS